MLLFENFFHLAPSLVYGARQTGNDTLVVCSGQFALVRGGKVKFFCSDIVKSSLASRVYAEGID